MGFGMNARGGTEIIIATLGLSIGLLTREMFSIIVVMAIVTVILSGPTMAWALSKVHRDDKTVDAAVPQFIYEEALEEPPLALNLVEQEELRLATRLKSYTRAMRTDAGSAERAAAAGIHEPFVAVASVAENFLQQLATQSLSPATSAMLISLENRLRLLRYIEESVRGLFTSSVRMPAGTALRSHLDSYTEGLDYLLDRMLEALTLKDTTAAEAFATLTEGRSEILEGVRSDSIRRATKCLRMTYLFGRSGDTVPVG
jgi:Na+/phosphate symporter